MNNFNEQLDNDLERDIAIFNNNPDYKDIRDLYRNNFDIIVSYIERSNIKLAIEDIASLDISLKGKIMNDILFLKEINKAISKGRLSRTDIK